ncbi:AAA family ATPase [Dokdonia ponticola]|uniref:AAA family ATPase n=1 Tax=Dokdonia ponticola TaxID=2041041 RepID=A0ABV9HTP7_9FLAO
MITSKRYKQLKLDIPEIDQIPNFMKILDDLIWGNNVFLVGSAGTGKTTLAEKVSYSLFGRHERDKKELPYITINCSQWTSPTEIKGGQTMTGYKEGGLVEAWRDGKILILDEMPKLDANTASLLNDALAKSASDEAIIFNGLNEPIVKHPDFGCIATGNTTGKGFSKHYVGNSKQDASLIDRFSGCIYHVGFNERLEKALIYPTLVAHCQAIRSAILRYEAKDAGDDTTEDIMTLRTMLNLQRSYVLEMFREMGIKDANDSRFIPYQNGKTLQDALDSYFWVMNSEKAKKIKAEISYDGFINTYKSAEAREEFSKEYARRV